MRLFPVGLAVLGIVLGVGLPVLGAGRLPVLLGAACWFAAGVVAARQAQRRGAVLVLAGLVAAVAVLAAPRIVTGVRNGQGIAWAVPAGERVVLAEHGLAVTRDADGVVLTGRDLATGKQRWRRELPKPESPSAQFSVQRVGETLIVHTRDDKLDGLELATGIRRWRDIAGGAPVIASPDVFAYERCERRDCVVEARSVQDGTLRWHADQAGGDGFLGAPHSDRGNVPSRPLWPASVALLRTGERAYEVHDLATGRVLRRVAANASVAIDGAAIVRSRYDGDLWATDAVSGRELWRRPDDGGRASRSPNTGLDTLALPDGNLVLTGHGDELPTLFIGDTLRLVDPRTGKLTESKKLVDDNPDIVDSHAQAVTAATAAAGVPPLPPVLATTFDEGGGEDEVQADGRVYPAGDLQRYSTAATAAQVGWESDQHAFGAGERDGAEVHDRRTGKRLLRYSGEHVDIRTVGERLVLSVGEDEDVRDFVVAS